MLGNEITIRKATRADLPEIIVLLGNDSLGQSREIVELPLDQKYVGAFNAIESDSNQLLVVMDFGGEVAGCLQLSFIPGLSRTGMWRAQIESVRIAERMRGKGAGSLLINWAIEQAKARECGLVQLTSDKQRPEALRFYENLGFEASHEGFKLKLV